MAVPFGFGFVPAGGADCCTCEGGCTACDSGDYLITLEPVGSGWVMLVSDDDMIGADWINCSGANADFWSNVAAFIGNGTVGAPDGSESNYRPGDTTATGMEPTVGVVSATDLVGLAAAWCGFFQGIISDSPYAFLPVTPTELKSWIEGGGLLIVVSESSADPTGDQIVHNFNLATNLLLADLGSCSRFIDADVNAGCATPTVNSSSPLIDGTYGTANPDLKYLRAGYCCPGSAGTWVARVGTGGEPDQCDTINDGPYGILNAPGTLGGNSFSVCMTYDTGSEGESWYGETDVTLACGTKTLGIRIYCDNSVPKWKVNIVNVTDDVTETYDFDYTSLDPLAGTISETLSNFCGSDVIVASVAACTAPPFAACCPTEDLASLCCIDFDNVPMVGSTEAIDPEGVADIGEDCTGSNGSMGYSEDPLTVNVGGSPYTPAGFDPANGYLSGAWPFNTNSWITVLYCDGGTLKTFTYDPGNSNEIIRTEQALNDQTCIGGWIEYADAESGCFIPGGVNRRIDFG